MKSRPWQGGDYEKAQHRVRKTSTYELLEWADAAGSGMAKGFMDYRQHDSVESLDEIELALVALMAVTHELKIRHKAGAQ